MQKTCRVFIRDLEIDWHVGVYDREQGLTQTLLFNVTLEAEEPSDPDADDYDQVVCYDTLAGRLLEMAQAGHVKLLETLAHRSVQMCLEDERVLRATVRVEKLTPTTRFQALQSMGGAGVEITRSREEMRG